MSKENDDYGREYERDEVSHEAKHGSLIGSLVLISTGIVFLLATFVPALRAWNLWPVIVFAAGIGIAASIIYKIKKRRQ
jgi:hypothetical protein